jgi:hypothetical protein
MHMTITKMAQDLLDRIVDFECDPEPQYEPELEALTPMQRREIKASLDKLIRGEYLDNPLEGC